MFRMTDFGMLRGAFSGFAVSSCRHSPSLARPFSYSNRGAPAADFGSMGARLQQPQAHHQRPPLPPPLLQPPVMGQRLENMEDSDLNLQQLQQLRVRRTAVLPAFSRQARRPALRLPYRRGSQQGAGPSQLLSNTQPFHAEREQMLRAVDSEDQEDADMRLAARLQAEEDERLAKETAHRLEQEEHHRVIVSTSHSRGRRTAFCV